MQERSRRGLLRRTMGSAAKRLNHLLFDSKAISTLAGTPFVKDYPVHLVLGRRNGVSRSDEAASRVRTPCCPCTSMSLRRTVSRTVSLRSVAALPTLISLGDLETSR